MSAKRKDNKNRVLKDGEYQRPNGTYEYRYRDRRGKRCSLYAKTLEELREKARDLKNTGDSSAGTPTGNAKMLTINDAYDLWLRLKRGLKDNTFSNYMYMYEQFIRPDFGTRRLDTLKKSDVRLFYNYLGDKLHLKVTTIDNVHTVLHQVLELAVEDEYIRTNPSDGALKEMKQSHNYGGEHRRALTVEEQKRLLTFLTASEQYSHWLPIITVMLEEGLRVGEATGLRWEDVDLENNLIDVNHTLIYYNHRVGGPEGCYFSINTPKTAAGRRIIPMTSNVKAAFQQEQNYQLQNGITNKARVDGYTDFIFVNRYGEVQHQGTINKALRRIIRDCNQEALEWVDAGKLRKKDLVLLPKFSCHSLRHTCATRLCEAGVNMKVVQEFLGHADIKTTMNIYTDATPEFKASEISRFDEYLADHVAEQTSDEKES